MSRKNFHATTALGLCLAMLPVSVNAQSSDLDTDAAEMFVPMVQDCVLDASEEGCQQVRTVITECAQDLDFARCQLLFEDPNAVLRMQSNLIRRRSCSRRPGTPFQR